MKWGILGGTFDPIHLGHLRCAEEIREAFALDEVIFIPAFQPPHKEDGAIASFAHREQMIRLSIAGYLFSSFSDLEKRRQGKSYSIRNGGVLFYPAIPRNQICISSLARTPSH